MQGRLKLFLMSYSALFFSLYYALLRYSVAVLKQCFLICAFALLQKISVFLHMIEACQSAV